MSDEDLLKKVQAREIAVKFGRNAVSLVERGKALDVCARKFLAAAVALDPNVIGTSAARVAQLQLQLSQADENLDKAATRIKELLRNSETMKP